LLLLSLHELFEASKFWWNGLSMEEHNFLRLHSFKDVHKCMGRGDIRLLITFEISVNYLAMSNVT